MPYVLRLPPRQERGPQYLEPALAAVHQASNRRRSLRLSFVRSGRGTALQFDCPPALERVWTAQLYAAYPDAELAPVTDPSVPADHVIWTAPTRFVPDLFPLRPYTAFNDTLHHLAADPIAAILGVLEPRDKRIQARIDIDIRPARSRVIRRAKREAVRLTHPRFLTSPCLRWLYVRWRWSSRLFDRLVGHAWGYFLSGSRSSTESHARELAVQRLEQHVFEVRIRLTISAPSGESDIARSVLRDLAAAFVHVADPATTRLEMGSIRQVLANGRRPRIPRSLLTVPEVALLWHPPTEVVSVPALSNSAFRDLPPPVELFSRKTQPELAVLGETAFRGEHRRCGLLPDDRRRHLALFGKTGMGKSSLLQQLLACDIAAGRGVALVDPHGDLCELVLQSIPRHRTNAVILLDAADTQHPVSFNPLDCPTVRMRPLVAGGLLSAFKKLYGESWGPRLEHILRNVLFTLLELPGSTLATVPRLLTDAQFRRQVTERLSDPIVYAFWTQEFAQMPAKLQAEATAPILNKVGQFLTNPILRHILTQPESRLDLRRVMNGSQVLLVNVSKGLIGEDASTLLGSFLITALQVAAMSRADVAENQRPDFFLYVDEFGSFATDGFANILSEARKYRLSLIVAAQYLAQLSDNTLAAVFGNIGSMLAFQVGAQDAPVLAEQLGMPALPEDLMMLPKHHAYARLLIDGQPTRPFSLRTLPPTRLHLDLKRAEIIRRASQRRYSRPLSEVRHLLGAQPHYAKSTSPEVSRQQPATPTTS